MTEDRKTTESAGPGAIPDIADPERYEARDFRPSGFLEITDNEYFAVEMQYPLLGMRNAQPRCLVREEVYERLVRAAKALPGGMRLKLLDAWRPFALQKELYEVYSARIIRDFGLGDRSEEERNAVIQKFVSDPVPDRDVPPVHTTGGAVDVIIIGEDGAELDMGTGFDAFTEKTWTAYFEKVCGNPGSMTSLDSAKREKEIYSENMTSRIRENRRLLYQVMTGAGFTNLPSEWWHFDYGDRFWAYYEKKPAIYRGVFTEEEMDGGSKEK